jgi:hypothetical protein
VNNSGVALDIVAQVLGHDSRTNKKHYRTAIEPLIVLPLNLIHRDDPRPQEDRKAAGG